MSRALWPGPGVRGERWAVEATSVAANAPAAREGARLEAPEPAGPSRTGHLPALQGVPGGGFVPKVMTRGRMDHHAMGRLIQPVRPEVARMILQQALRGDLEAQWELFSLMEDSWDRLAKNLNEVKQAVKKLDWVVSAYAVRGEDPSGEAEAKADLVEKAMQNWQPEIGTLEHDFEGAIYHGLDAMGKGISVQEIHWHQFDGAVLPRAAHLLTPRQYGWNGEGTKLGLRSRSGQLRSPSLRAGPQERMDWEPFPAQQFWVGQWHARSGVPGATALLRPLVPYWIGMTYGWQWLMQTAQLFGVPFRWATYDPNEPGLVNTISEMLEGMGSAGWAAFPAGTTLEFKEAITSATDNPQAVVMDLARRACDLLILGQELSGETEGTGLGSGVADLQGQVRQEVLHRASWWIADVMNYQFVPAVLELNFGEVTEPPVIAPDLAAGIDPKGLVERDQILAGMGLKMPVWWLYERHNVPEPQPGEEVLERPQLNDPFGMGGAGSFGGFGMGDGRWAMGDGGTSVPATAPAAMGDGGSGMTPQQRARRAALMRWRRGGGAGMMGSLAGPANAIQAADEATERLIENVLEDLTGVQARWLGGVKPFFRRLVEAAQDPSIPDADLLQTLEAAQREFPELFGKLDHKALAEALEGAMGAAMVNGAVRGALARRVRAGRANSNARDADAAGTAGRSES